MIRATEADRLAIEAFLTNHIATSMFPLSNLRSYGMSGGHPRAVTFWARWLDGQITDVLTVTDEGFLFPQCPTGPWGDIRAVLAGQAYRGILGDARQVAALRQALSWQVEPGIDDVEPLYHLSLSDLQLPDCEGFELYPLADAPKETVLGWRTAYLTEVMPVPGEEPDVTAAKDIAAYLDANSHRALYRDGTPVAMTGFNAQLPQVVQIGGVYTQPEFRGQGVARRAVGLHLKEAHNNGVKDAILFAASDNAARAYEAIGFNKIGAFSILLYEEPQVVHV
ncbi:GNAT family N-acetyltransferase [Yoonia maritima]|uniref:GNAT family N-acetyltransferase n=1 Tax=Yoonia maritima TaxID=1435347 RepID=UPI000D0FF6E2|nr:GNAT family N-acetyltransferase [Yoonia maritima]